MKSVARTVRPGIRRRILATYARPFSSAPAWRSDRSAETSELEVGQLEGAKFKIEPLRRTGEDPETMRARLVYQSRKRGILESDLLLSTFAQAYLPSMTPVQLQQYDLFLDENDWDIYYWATQRETDASSSPDLSSNSISAETTASTTSPDNVVDEVKRDPPRGEWAQTVGNFKPAYRPVPRRWKDSEVLALLRQHVRSRSVNGGVGGGMAFMPALEQRQ